MANLPSKVYSGNAVRASTINCLRDAVSCGLTVVRGLTGSSSVPVQLVGGQNILRTRKGGSAVLPFAVCVNGCAVVMQGGTWFGRGEGGTVGFPYTEKPTIETEGFDTSTPYDAFVVPKMRFCAPCVASAEKVLVYLKASSCAGIVTSLPWAYVKTGTASCVATFQKELLSGAGGAVQIVALFDGGEKVDCRKDIQILHGDAWYRNAVPAPSAGLSVAWKEGKKFTVSIRSGKLFLRRPWLSFLAGHWQYSLSATFCAPCVKCKGSKVELVPFVSYSASTEIIDIVTCGKMCKRQVPASGALVLCVPERVCVQTQTELGYFALQSESVDISFPVEGTFTGSVIVSELYASSERASFFCYTGGTEEMKICVSSPSTTGVISVAGLIEAVCYKECLTYTEGVIVALNGCFVSNVVLAGQPTCIPAVGTPYPATATELVPFCVKAGASAISVQTVSPSSIRKKTVYYIDSISFGENHTTCLYGSITGSTAVGSVALQKVVVDSVSGDIAFLSGVSVSACLVKVTKTEVVDFTVCFCVLGCTASSTVGFVSGLSSELADWSAEVPCYCFKGGASIGASISDETCVQADCEGASGFIDVAGTELALDCASVNSSEGVIVFASVDCKGEAKIGASTAENFYSSGNAVRAVNLRLAKQAEIQTEINSETGCSTVKVANFVEEYCAKSCAVPCSLVPLARVFKGTSGRVEIVQMFNGVDGSVQGLSVAINASAENETPNIQTEIGTGGAWCNTGSPMTLVED